MASSSDDLILALKETLRYGLFLGTFAGTFVSVDEIIATLGGHRRTARWRALLAGAIAGPSMLLTGLNTQHTSLAIYILMRATVLASRCGIKSKRFGQICKPLTWAHRDIFLMCLSSSQILSNIQGAARRVTKLRKIVEVESVGVVGKSDPLKIVKYFLLECVQLLKWQQQPSQHADGPSGSQEESSPVLPLTLPTPSTHSTTEAPPSIASTPLHS